MIENQAKQVKVEESFYIQELEYELAIAQRELRTARAYIKQKQAEQQQSATKVEENQPVRQVE
ncbi:hypothetical protein [Sutcliffiella rhizosphaerae]|uniref:Transposase n=1 Tax=Sutcliffiella rhizosphaerae TaxID=2880967 RepID=A0ABN8A9J6_9BACI|nr:hypothetical protein [Sutcliffiella rhizosphaerae]CAG9621086.1 hypothetical protein BACCIP111883_01858 [Sutcliffiella rhizosphaerae]